MASFISILKKIGSVAVSAERVAVPIISALDPAAAPILAAIDGIFQRLQASIVTVEASTPIDGAGTVKADAVTADFQSGLDLTQQILALEKKHLAYDAVALQTAISSQVAAYNAFAALKASFKIEALS